MILDHSEQLRLESSEGHQNEIGSLGYLWQGLEFLNRQVQATEAEICQRVDAKHHQVSLIGNAPQLRGIPMGLVACAFHWYAASACNYVRLIGWLAKDGDSEAALSYVKRVIPSVKEWRDKVGAHFALVNPRRGDTPANLAASVMFPVGFEDRWLWAHPFTLAVTHGGTSSQSAIPTWSLSRIHEQLIARYTKPGAGPESKTPES